MMLFVLVCSEESLFLVCLYRLGLPCALSCFAFFCCCCFRSCLVRFDWPPCQHFLLLRVGQPGRRWMLPRIASARSDVAPDHVTFCRLFVILSFRVHNAAHEVTCRLSSRHSLIIFPWSFTIVPSGLWLTLGSPRFLVPFRVGGCIGYIRIYAYVWQKETPLFLLWCTRWLPDKVALSK